MKMFRSQQVKRLVPQKKFKKEPIYCSIPGRIWMVDLKRDAKYWEIVTQKKSQKEFIACPRKIH